MIQIFKIIYAWILDKFQFSDSWKFCLVYTFVVNELLNV